MNLSVYGGAFYGDAPDETHPWCIHDDNRPQPRVVTPDKNQISLSPPSDAISLFNGKNFSQWANLKPDLKTPAWEVKEGELICVPHNGSIRSQEEFGDCQLHLEWAAPRENDNVGQNRGNSGIFIMGICEIQILDNYHNQTYADGTAGAYYGVVPPLVNALRPSGEFQFVDIIFRRPIYKNNQLLDSGSITVLINGVLVQDHVMIEGPTGHRSRVKATPFPEKGPLVLQDHHHKVRFRNIWYRPLPPRAIEGGTDGPISAEATTAKRKEIAAVIRKDSEILEDSSNPLPQLIRVMESLVYEKNDEAYQKTVRLADQYVATVSKLTGEELTTQKEEIIRIKNSFEYCAKFKVIPADFPPLRTLLKIYNDQGWNNPKK